MLRILMIAAVLHTAVVAGHGPAAAQARHERVRVKPIVKGGKVVGATIRLLLRPDHHHNEDYDRVRVGLGSHDAARIGADFRRAASDPRHGYLLLQFPEEAGVVEPTERTYTLLYGQGNTLRGGEEVDLVSAWSSTERGPTGAPWHVFGMARRDHDVPQNLLTLPGKPPPAAKGARPGGVRTPAAPPRPARAQAGGGRAP